MPIGYPYDPATGRILARLEAPQEVLDVQPAIVVPAATHPMHADDAVQWRIEAGVPVAKTILTPLLVPGATVAVNTPVIVTFANTDLPVHLVLAQRERMLLAPLEPLEVLSDVPTVFRVMSDHQHDVHYWFEPFTITVEE